MLSKISNFFYLFKYFFVLIIAGALLTLVGTFVSFGDKYGIFVQPAFVGIGSAIVVLAFLKQYHTLKEEGYFDSFSFKSIFSKKKKKVKQKPIIAKTVKK